MHGQAENIGHITEQGPCSWHTHKHTRVSRHGTAVAAAAVVDQWLRTRMQPDPCWVHSCTLPLVLPAWSTEQWRTTPGVTSGRARLLQQTCLPPPPPPPALGTWLLCTEINHPNRRQSRYLRICTINWLITWFVIGGTNVKTSIDDLLPVDYIDPTLEVDINGGFERRPVPHCGL